MSTDTTREPKQQIDLIDGARRSLRILYYIYADDESGRRVNAALVAAARRGVTVRIMRGAADSFTLAASTPGGTRGVCCTEL